MSKFEVAQIARKIVALEIEPIEGARAIVALRGSLSKAEENDSDFVTLIAFESESDRYPSGSVRDLWDADALVERDRERDRYLARALPSLLDACSSLVARWF